MKTLIIEAKRIAHQLEADGAKITVSFEDPGSKPYKVEIPEKDLQKVLAKEGTKKRYTRAFVERPGVRHWSATPNTTFVRNIGETEWKDWSKMSPQEREEWEEQDKT